MASAIKGYKANLINGGIAAFNSNEEGTDAKALDFFGTYVDLAGAEMFAKDNLAVSDTLMPTIAYYAALAGIRSENYPAVEKYAPIAQADKENGQNATEFLIEALKKQDKTDQMLSVLKEAINKFPGNQAFFANMIDYYSANEKYDEALESYKKCTEIKPDYYDAWYQCGLCKYKQALALNSKVSTIKNQVEAKKALEKTKSLFGEAIPFFEKARECAPDEPMKWAFELRQCYTVTGQAAKAAEMDKLL
jgi:tetratricopeptide (TPR) repeat protein